VPPTLWEIPASAAAAWLSLALLALPAGRGCAGWLFGGGWMWSHGSGALRRSIGGMLTGQPNAGLTAAEAGQLPASWATYALVFFVEVLLLVATVWMGTLWWQYLGPGMRDGMATRVETGAVLGVAALQRSRRVIRPDLYGPERRHRRRVWR
jgi:type IV secretion system protein VirD4